MLFNFDKLIVYFQVLSCGFCKTAQVQVKVWWHLLFVTGSYRDDIVYKHFFFHYYYYLNLKRILCHWYLFYNWNTSRTKLAQRFQANFFSRSMREETHEATFQHTRGCTLFLKNVREKYECALFKACEKKHTWPLYSAFFTLGYTFFSEQVLWKYACALFNSYK